LTEGFLLGKRKRKKKAEGGKAEGRCKGLNEAGER